MAAASTTNDLILEVRRSLGHLEALSEAMDTLVSRVPDFEAQFPGATEAARSMAETMTGLIDELPSPAQVRRLVTGLVEEVAPPVDAAGFRAQLEAATSQLIGIVDSLASGLPGAPAIDTERLASFSGDALGQVPDPVVAQIGGLLEVLDLPAVAARAAELVALADEVRDELANQEKPTPEQRRTREQRLKGISRTVVWILASLQITTECLSWLEISFPIHAGVNGFVVVKIDIGRAFGATAAQVIQFQLFLIVAILYANYLLLVIKRRIKMLKEEG